MEELKSFVKVNLTKSSTSGKEGYSIDVCAAENDKADRQEAILTKLAENALNVAFKMRSKL